MNRKSLAILEFDKIREKLAACTQTDGGRELAENLSPSSDIYYVKKRQILTTQAKLLSEEKGSPSFYGVHDIISAAERASKGAALSMRELLNCGNALKCARTLRNYTVSSDGYEEICEIFDRLIPNKYLEDRITMSIISEDVMADDASPELADIRRSIKRTNLKIRDMLQKYVSGDSKYLQENIITTRGGRFVIPVKSEYRNEVKGLIHDTSQSGSTLFIEPMSVVEANNELRTLEAKETNEIERILYELSGLVADCSSAMKNNYRNIIELDLIFASAELSVIMKAVSPEITDCRKLTLNRARHPLLDSDKVVPITVKIGGEYNMLVITGPNTGGKTVTLKTVGLLSAMAQSGLHIPTDENSVVCIFDDIFAEIGDEQSIEQSLSTFSSHMKGIVNVLDSMTEQSLIIFDELGSGTDPVEGAALATAILDEVRLCTSLCVATTHYAELKAYAIETDGVMNASCEFDVATLRPTYRLIIGTPGKSNAFAISEKLGLPQHIVERAHGLIEDNSRSFENVIEKLESARGELEKEKNKTAQLRAEYEKFKSEAESELQEKLKNAEEESRKIVEKAQRLLDGARATSEYVFTELDAVKKARNAANLSDKLASAKKDVRRRMREYDDELNPVYEDSDDGYVLPRDLKKGDQVVHKNLKVSGVLLEDPDKNGNVSVRMGTAKTRANIKDLKLIEGVKQEKKKSAVSTYKATVSKNFKPECDIRGMIGDDGCFILDKYLDEALVAGIKSVTVIHGKGTGALRNAIWKFLKNDKRVANYRAGQYGEGDYGVTVVELK
ncbi:MAG: endonuclease MutS2 [Clostridiales bacterium]|nr:endonuclease MutS2 [Clostridiales bacterium]